MRRLAGATVVGDDVIASTGYMKKQPLIKPYPDPGFYTGPGFYLLLVCSDPRALNEAGFYSREGSIRGYTVLCKPRAFSPAITRTWNTWSRTESACVESTTRHYNRGARGRTYTPADHRRMRLRGNVHRSSITDVKRKYTKHCNVNKMVNSSGLGPSKFITLLTL